MHETIDCELDSIMNILIGSGFNPYRAEKLNWGTIVRFEHEGKQLMCHSMCHTHKLLEVFYWADDSQHSCWGFEEELNLIEGWSTSSHDIA